MLHDLCTDAFSKRSTNTALELYEDVTGHDQPTQPEKFLVKSLTYSQLGTICGKIESVIKDVSKENIIIGLYMEPCLEFAACVLSVLKAQCAFMPVNIEWGPEKTVHIIAACGIEYVIANSRYADIFERRLVECCITLCSDLMGLGTEFGMTGMKMYRIEGGGEKKVKSPFIKDLAYCMYTSGTTGNPKIVRVPHHCIIPNILHLRHFFCVNSNSKVAMMSPTTFDPFVVEMFLALSSGATLVMLTKEIRLNPRKLSLVLFNMAKVTIMQSTPSLMKRFSVSELQNQIFTGTSSLKIFAFGGEACPSCKTIKSWVNPKIMELAGHCSSQKEEFIFPQRFFNLYGITEVSSWASCYEISPQEIIAGSDKPVSLGFPLLNTILEVRSEDTNSIILTICTKEKDKLSSEHSTVSRCQEEKIWTDSTGNFNVIISHNRNVESFPLKGILYIGGLERACYLSSDECIRSSQEKTNPKLANLAMRNSGDIVNVIFTLTEVIEISFLQRKDSLVKRNGKLVNLAKLTEIIEMFSDIKSCHVIPVPSEDDSDFKLVGFIVRIESEEDCYTTTSSLQTIIPSSYNSKLWSFKCFIFLSGKVETHCLPDNIIEINMMPITHHGKVDANCLIHLFNNRLGTTSDITKQMLLNSLQFILPSLLKNQLERSVNPNRRFDDLLKYNFLHLGGDSLHAVMLISWLEHFLDISITSVYPDAIQSLLDKSLHSFMDVLYDKLNSKFVCNKITGLKRSHQCESVTKSKSFKDDYAVFCSIRRGGLICCYSKEYWKTLHEMLYNKIGVEIKEIMWSIGEEWKYNTHKCIDASPLLLMRSEERDAYCYIGSHSHEFAAISMKDGSKIWNTILPDRIESSACLSPNGAFVIVGCYDGVVYIFRSDSGKREWKFATDSTVKSSPCPGPQGSSLVYVGSHDGFLYALDIEKKMMLWNADCGGGGIFSSPCIFPDNDDMEIHTIFVATLGGNILSISCKTGEKKWCQNLEKPVFSSPAVSYNGLCVGCVDKCVYFLNRYTGQKIWSFRTEQPIFSSPCFSHDHQSIFIGSHDGFLYKISVSSGSVIWRSMNMGSPIYATPFQLDNCWEDVVIAASTQGTLFVISQKNGVCLATRKLLGEIFSSPVAVNNALTSTSCTNTNGNKEDSLRVIIGCRDDHLYCFKILHKSLEI